MTRIDGIENPGSYLAEHRHDWYSRDVIACDVACCFTSRHADDVQCARKDPAPLATAGVRQPTNRSGGYMSKSSASTGSASRLNVHRLGNTVSLWKGTGSRIEIDVNDVAEILNGLWFPPKMVDECRQWGRIVHHINEREGVR